MLSPGFQWPLVHPSLWPTWLGLALTPLLTVLPARLRNLLAVRLATHYVSRHGRHRFLAEQNIIACFPHLDASAREKLLLDYFTGFFQVLFQTPMMWWWPQSLVHRRIELAGDARVDALIAQNRSVVFLVSHSIALDFGLIGLARKYSLHGIYKPFNNPVIDWIVRRSRQRFGGITVARDAGLRSIIREQQKGKCLVYLGDEDLGHKGSVFASFFSSRKATLKMLPRIVRKVDAVVIPVFTHYDSDRQSFIVTLLPPLTDYPEESDVVNAEKMNKAIEQSVMTCSAQYFWKLKYFKTTEDGSPDIYAKARNKKTHHGS